MPKYRLISVDKFELTDVRGDPQKALAALGGPDGVKKLVESFINGGSRSEPI